MEENYCDRCVCKDCTTDFCPGCRGTPSKSCAKGECPFEYQEEDY